jgi:hypothetical protein
MTKLPFGYSYGYVAHEPVSKLGLFGFALCLAAFGAVFFVCGYEMGAAICGGGM